MKKLKVLLIALCIFTLCSCGKKDVHADESVMAESVAVEEFSKAVEEISREVESAASELKEKEKSLKEIEDELTQKISDMEAAQDIRPSGDMTGKSIEEIAREKLGLINPDEILFKEKNQGE